MKTLFIIFMITLSAGCQAQSKEEQTEVKEQKTCIKVYDVKQNKEVEKCRVLKIHKKKNGIQVQEIK